MFVKPQYKIPDRIVRSCIKLKKNKSDRVGAITQRGLQRALHHRHWPGLCPLTRRQVPPAQLIVTPRAAHLQGASYQMPRDSISFAPLGLRRAQASLYVGLSATHFDKLVAEGLMPTPRLAGGVKLWLRSELEFALLELEQDSGGHNSCHIGEYDLNI